MMFTGSRPRSTIRFWQAGAVLLVLALVGLSIYTVLAAPPGNAHFQSTWQRTDKVVLDGITARTWMWGPEAFTEVLHEPYADTPGSERQVQYFDKARMEITHPDADATSIWYVTNGLLVVELITGNMQTGDAAFEQRSPADVNVAGDADDPTGPTYATFGTLLDATPHGLGTAITERVDRDGDVTDDPALANAAVAVGYSDDVTNHAIAVPFWDFMNSSGTVYDGEQFIDSLLFENPYFATGRPITEAYWANVKVAGTYRDVLMQCFERRCLTYTPGNPDGFIVEAGNVGQHYYSWRYGQQPGDPTPTTTTTATGTVTASPTVTMTTSPTPTTMATATATATEAPLTEYEFAAQWGKPFVPRDTASPTVSPFSLPVEIAIDGNNHIWVVDAFGFRLDEFDEHGVYLRSIGERGSDPGQFESPTDATFGDDGRLYVVDQNNARIQVFTPDGSFVKQWGKYGTGDGEFRTPTGIGVLGPVVYVVDGGNDRVQMFDLEGTYQGQFGSEGTGDGQFNFPDSVAFNSQGNVYVVDSTNNRIQWFTSSGTYLGQFGSAGAGNGSFDNPASVDIDADGAIYVVDFSNDRVQKFNPDHTFAMQWGQKGNGFGQFDSPVGLTLDGNGNVYVTEYNNHRIQKFSGDGAFLFEIYQPTRGTFGNVSAITSDQDGNLLTTDTNKFVYDGGSVSRFAPDGTPLDALSWTRPDAEKYDQLEGVAVNPQTGDIYVVDRFANHIQRFTSTWQYRGKWGTPGTIPGQFNGPTDIEIDADGNVYVADAGNNRIQKFDANGVFLEQWGGVGSGNGQFQQPAGIAIDGERVYVSDYGNHRVQVFTRNGDYIDQWGSQGAGLGELNGPIGLAVTSQGLVLVVESANNRVQIFSPDGEGLNAFGSLGSGPGQFNVPSGIAVDGDGNVYVTDILNYRVQKFQPKP